MAPFRGSLLADRRGAVAIMAAVLGVPMLGAAALAADASIWLLEQHRLQIAADAAAYTAALQLSNTSMQSGAPGSYATLVGNEIQAVGGGSLLGTLATPAISVTRDFSSVTVTLTSTADTFFVNALRSAPVSLTASATAGSQPATPCVLALNPTASRALDAGGNNGAGSIVTTGCPVYANSSASDAIYVNSATVNATSIGTHGGFSKSNSGSNNVSPTPSTGGGVQQDPLSSYAAPSAGSCMQTNYTLSVYGNNTINPGTYCGNTFIGGNGGTYTFKSGVYLFTGNLTINNANITSAAGVTFIMLPPSAGAAAGSFTWQNNSSATMTAPTSGPYAGLFLWQACPSNATSGSNTNPLVDFNGGSALTLTGTIYAPCGTLQLDNNAQVTAASGSSMSAIASIINVWQSASFKPASATSGTGAGQVSLLQ